MEAQTYIRPKTRGELLENIKKNIPCEVVASNENVTTPLLNSLLILQRLDGWVKFKTRPSENPGWVVYELDK